MRRNTRVFRWAMRGAMLAVASAAAAGSAVAAQGVDDGRTGRPTYEVRRAAGPIEVDGALGEDTWDLPPTFTLDFETSPGDNVPPPVETEVWLAYDRERLYVAVRAHDPEPGAIRARLRDRDDAFQDDFVGVVLDTFNDERRAFQFFVNPLGVQMDMSNNDVSGGEDSSWDALWSSAGRLTPGGYEVEMAIPFSSLRFPPREGEQTWGIDAVRIWPRDQRRRIGLVPLPRGRNCYLCNEAKLVGLEGITPGRNVELAPTLTGTEVASRTDPSQPLSGDSEVEAGVTARWGVTPGTTLNATINPDFSQVEADAAQLDVNTNFALFFPEKRPFFLEGGDIFSTRINAVYTRTIADPDWGLKVTGKSGKHAYGAIVAQDNQTNLLIPGSQGSRFAFLDEESTASILRYRRDLAGSSTLGALFTSREGDGYSNRVVGADGLFRWGEGIALRLEVLGSQTEYPETLGAAGTATDGLDGLAIRGAYQHQTREWMGYFLYNDVSPDFRADLGFIPQAGYRTGYGLYERYWYADGRDRWWSRLTAGVETTWSYDHEGEPLQRQVVPFFWLNGPRQSFANVFLALGPSWFRGRELDRNAVGFDSEMQVLPWAYVGLEGRIGEEIDYENAQQADILRLVPEVRFDLGRHLRLDLAHRFERLDVDRGELYRANLSELRLSYQVNVRTLVRLVTQYRDLTRDPALYASTVDPESSNLFNQLLFSYKVNPQTVVFLGYSDNYRAEQIGLSALDQSNRTLFVKLGYALVL